MKTDVLSHLKTWQEQFRRYVSRHDLALAVLITLILVLVGLGLGYSNNGVVPSYPKAHYHYTAEPANPLSFMSNWDGPDYLHIVHDGYQHNLFYANFFPLYPLVVYLFNLVIHSTLDCALLVSWLSLAGAIYFYIKIAKTLFNFKDSDRSIKALAPFVLFPSGIFLIATYSESLYALLALSAIYCSLKKKYLAVGLLLLLCTAAHITGLFVLILCLLILLEQKVGYRKIIVAKLLGLIGIASYMYYCWHQFHSPIAFIKSQEQVHGWLKHNFTSLLTSADPLNAVFVILLLISAIYWWSKRKSFSVYSLLFLLIPLAGRQYGGFNRYVLMAFPMQLMIYDYISRKRQAYTYLVALLAVGWTYFALQYMGGYIGN